MSNYSWIDYKAHIFQPDGQVKGVFKKIVDLKCSRGWTGGAYLEALAGMIHQQFFEKSEISKDLVESKVNGIRDAIYDGSRWASALRSGIKDEPNKRPSAKGGV